MARYEVTVSGPEGAKVIAAEVDGFGEALKLARGALLLPEGDRGHSTEDFPGVTIIYPDVAESTLDNPRRAVVRQLPNKLDEE